MFNVNHNECVGFESRWKVKKVSSVGATQTTEYSTAEVGTSTVDKATSEAQTEQPDPASNHDVDEERLAKWLKRIYPQVKKELDDAANSKAFKGYRLSSDNAEANSKLIQSLNLFLGVNEAVGRCRVSALSWNCTGKTLAVSCAHNHNSWCCHEGFVAFYSLNRDDMLPETPEIKLKTESCIMVLQFHPALPFVIATGLFSGDIIMWNIQHEQEVVVKTVGHPDGVTQLSWTTDINAPKIFLLASSGLDGLLKLWDFNIATLALTIKEKYKIKSPILSKTSTADSASEEPEKKPVRGITCFDFSKYSPHMFVVGAEGGLVIQCSILGTTKLKGSTTEEPLLDPVVKFYEPHKGEVTSIKFSPNRKEMFMTSGSDGEIRIYVIEQEEPAQVIFPKNPIYCMTWIPYEEKIIAGCGISGAVEMFHVVKGQKIECTTKDKVTPSILTQIAVNETRSNSVAVGNEKGFVQFWRISWSLFGNLAS